MKITKHVYFYRASEIVKESDSIRPSNTIVISDKQEQIVIDPGINIRNKWDWLISQMRKDGLDIAKTAAVWLTHVHPDHSHLASKMVKEFKTKVCCHYLAKDILEAKNPFVAFEFRQTKAAGKFHVITLYFKGIQSIDILSEIKSMLKIVGGWKRVEVNQLFYGGEEILLGSLKVHVFSLPGHCPTELGFWIPEEGVLIAGDLIHPTKDGRTFFPVLNNFLSDFNQAKESIRKMKEIKTEIRVFRFLSRNIQPSILLPTHGEPVMGKKNIQSLFDSLLVTLEKYQEIAKDFTKNHPGLTGIKLVNKLAEKFSKELFQEYAPLEIRYEMRFASLLVLRSLGAIRSSKNENY